MITCLSTFIASNFEANRSGIYKNCIWYLMGDIKPAEFQKNTMYLINRRSASKEVKSLRLLIKRSFYVVQDLRAFLYGLYLDPSYKSMMYLGNKYNISMLDRKNCWKAHILNRKSIIDRVREVNIKSVMDLDFLNAQLEKMIPALNSYIRYHVNRKLYFISKSCNLEMRELMSEVMLKIVESYYWSMPSDKEYLHILNYLKRSALNHISVMIGFYTANKRSRLVSNDDFSDFNLIVTSENQMDLESIDAVLGEQPADTGEFEDKRSVYSIVNMYRLSPKPLLFIKMLMGEKNDIFSRWLKKRKIISRISTNETLMETVGSDLAIQYVSEFVGVTKEQSDKFINGLRTLLVNG
jgi:hypothetical protein